MTTTTTTAREYLRVSRDMSGRARSVAEQHGDHGQDAAVHGWELGEPYADPGIGASRYTRRIRGEFDALLSDLREGAFDAQVLILWESSRGSRRVGEWVELLDLAEQREVRIWVHTHQTLYDPTNARHRRTLLEDAVDSEFEVSRSRERVLRAKRASAAAGLPGGRLPYGYLREYDTRGRYVRQYEHPEQAAIVREVAQRFAAGETLYAIASDLNGRGVQPPAAGRWSQTTVRRLATSATHAGWLTHRGQVVGRGDWPALLSDQLWRDCAARAADPARRRRHDTQLRYLLTGAVQCGVCERGLRVTRTTQYVCDTGHVGARRLWLDNIVTELLLQRMERPDALQLLAPPARADAVAAAQREHADLTERLDGFRRAAAAGRVSPAGLAVVEAELLPQLEQAQRRAVPASVPTVLRELAQRPREVWPELGVALQREAITLVLDIRLMPHRRGSPYLDPSRILWSWRQSTA